MDRRDFIRNSLLILGCSCFTCGSKILYDYNSERTVCNGIHLSDADLGQKYLNKSEIPKRIRLDACSMCQLNCVRCFMRLNPEKVKKGCGLGYLKFKDFKKLIDDNKQLEEIGLSNNGEIFLNPELVQIIKYAHEKKILLNAQTGVNLNYLTDEQAEALVKYQFNNITVSIDGATPEVYAIYRRGGDFNTVINNIKKINFYKKKYNSKFPEMTYKFILFGHNEHEIDKAKVLAKKLNMYMWFVPNYDPTYSPVKNKKLVIEKTGVDPESSLASYFAKVYLKDHNKWWFCKDLWTLPQINWDGKVLGCCCGYGGNFGGNVFKDGLLKALNHPKMIYAKNMLINHSESIEEIPCYNCSNYSLMTEMNLELKPADRCGETWL